MNIIVKCHVFRTTTPQNPSRFCLNVCFFQVSTGAAHPEAHQSQIRVEEFLTDQLCEINMEILGETLAIAIRGSIPFCRDERDNFYLFNWQTGDLKMVRITPILYIN